MPDCKHCKGEGSVYPIISAECNFCFNHSEGKKTCCECLGKGWKKKAISSLCASCGGTGKK
jgi:hypothetical protein